MDRGGDDGKHPNAPSEATATAIDFDDGDDGCEHPLHRRRRAVSEGSYPEEPSEATAAAKPSTMGTNTRSASRTAAGSLLAQALNRRDERNW